MITAPALIGDFAPESPESDPEARPAMLKDVARVDRGAWTEKRAKGNGGDRFETCPFRLGEYDHAMNLPESAKKNLVQIIFCCVAAFLCFFAFLGAFWWPSFLRGLEEQALWLFLAGVVCLLLPFISRLRLPGFELDVMNERLSSVEATILRGEVVRTTRGEHFYIDKDGRRYALPDDSDQTANFLMSRRGVVQGPELDAEIEKYRLEAKVMDGVRNCKAMNYDGHLFVVLGGKKYHVPSWSFVIDWDRKQDFQDKEAMVTAEVLKMYPTGR